MGEFKGEKVTTGSPRKGVQKTLQFFKGIELV